MKELKLIALFSLLMLCCREPADKLSFEKALQIFAGSSAFDRAEIHRVELAVKSGDPKVYSNEELLVLNQYLNKALLNQSVVHNWENWGEMKVFVGEDMIEFNVKTHRPSRSVRIETPKTFIGTSVFFFADSQQIFN